MAAKTFLKTTLVISVFFVVLAIAGSVHAKTIYVDDDGPADFSNIQAAIDDANDGDIIIVNPGTYTGNGNRDIDFKGKAITVRSADPNDPNIVAATIIDCEGSDEDNHRGFYFRSGEDTNSILEGLTITNGLHSTGAGICCLGSSPTIRNNIITGNETGFDGDGGAGIGCWNGASPIITNNIISDNICAPGGGGGGIRCYDRCSPAITNCTFSRNSLGGIKINNSNPTISNCTFEGNLGGGVSSSSFSSPIFINCTFIGNSSKTGGGMRVYESNPTLINCSFIQNVATMRGGGIWVYGWDTASPTLINCTFAGNSAANYGGGMYNRDSTRTTLVNCTFTGNSADDAGGAVYNYGYDWSVRITLNNCTFSGNSAANGNDLACDSPYGPPSNVQVTNCILWDGENPIWNNDGSTITITYSDVHGDWPGEGNIDAAPCFVDPDGADDIPGTEDDNLRLSTGSPCIDAGDPNYIAGPNETDLEGKPRVIGGRVDMGAYEFLSQMILYVDTDATGANGGSSWADAFNFLQDALATAYYGDEICVAQGIYKPDQGAGITPGNREATFQLIDGVTTKGGYAGCSAPDPNARDVELYETILTGDLDGNDVEVNDPCDLENEPTRAENSYHVVTAVDTDETAVFDGFTITAGNANGKGWPVYQNFGGGMYNDSGSPSVINCMFSDNSASNRGGGIYNWGGSPTLTNCTFSGNSAGIGGGIENNGGSPRLTNCTFIGNSVRSRGGGVYSCCGWTVLMLTNCIFKGNWSYGDGGGLLCDNGRLMMINCTFSGNSARRGGGMWYIDGNDRYQTLAGCRFSGNSAHEGGGMYCTFSSPTLINCTLSGNSAEYGEGIYVEDSSKPTLTNCILWGNRNINGTDESAQFDEGDEFIINYCCVEGWNGHLGGVGNIDADPCFVEPGYWEDPCNTPYDPSDDVWINGDYHLLPDSPCIDAGDPNYIAEPNETDLDGRPRVIGGRIDMGPYEYGPQVPAEVKIVPHTINLASKGNWITCYIWLPEQYNVADMEPNSIFLEGQIQPEQFSVDEQQQVATARFSREDVQPILDLGDINIKITGQLTDGTVFEATDTIKVINKAGKN